MLLLWRCAVGSAGGAWQRGCAREVACDAGVRANKPMVCWDSRRTKGLCTPAARTPPTYGTACQLARHCVPTVSLSCHLPGTYEQHNGRRRGPSAPAIGTPAERRSVAPPHCLRGPSGDRMFRAATRCSGTARSHTGTRDVRVLGHRRRARAAGGREPPPYPSSTGPGLSAAAAARYGAAQPAARSRATPRTRPACPPDEASGRAHRSPAPVAPVPDQVQRRAPGPCAPWAAVRVSGYRSSSALVVPQGLFDGSQHLFQGRVRA